MKTGKVPAFLSLEMVKAVAYWVLPMVGWTTAMILVSLSDETLGILIFFLIFLHPAFTLPFGILDRTLKRLMKKTFDSLGKRSNWRKCLVRYFTMSAVHYLTIIAVAQLFMFKSWQHEQHPDPNDHDHDQHASGKKPKFGFTQRPYNTCECKDYDCRPPNVNVINEFDATHDVQDNVSYYVYAENYLIGLVVFPLFFHLIESFCLYLPDPIPILDFVLANKECCADSDEHAKDDTEMREHAVSTSETHAQPNTSSIQWYEIGCCILAITYLVLIPFCPKFFFPYSIEKNNSTMYHCCPLVENNQTTCYSNSFHMISDCPIPEIVGRRKEGYSDWG